MTKATVYLHSRADIDMHLRGPMNYFLASFHQDLSPIINVETDCVSIRSIWNL